MGLERVGKPLSDRLVTGTKKFGGGSVMVWGCMTWDGAGLACKIDGKMDADLYCKILEDELQGTLKYYDKSPYDIIFQQDNDSKHTSEKAQTWFKNHGFQLLQWPAQSPDLNPIEHLWTHIKRSLENVKGLPIGCEMVFSLSHVVNCRGLPMKIMGFGGFSHRF